MAEKLTACRECKHHICTDHDPIYSGIWYSNRCGAVEVNATFNPLTGKFEKPEGVERFRYVREVNDGNCPKFEAKSGGYAG